MIPDAPIFTAWYDLNTWLLDRIESFPKHTRFTYGQRITNLALEIEERIVEALYSASKLGPLEYLNQRLNVLRISVRRCRDRQFLTIKQYRHASSKIDEVGRMLGGWIRQQRSIQPGGELAETAQK